MFTIIKRALWVVPLVLLGWLGVMVLVMRFSDAAPAAVVPFPSAAFMQALPQGTAILEISALAVTFANQPDLTPKLYQAGAKVVLPAGLTGCLPLTQAQRAKLAKS